MSHVVALSVRRQVSTFTLPSKCENENESMYMNKEHPRIQFFTEKRKYFLHAIIT